MTTVDSRWLAAAQDSTLADCDHVKFLGDPVWYGVGALRAAVLPTSDRRGELRTMNQEEDGVTQEDEMTGNYAPVNSYEPHLKQLRAAAATPDSTFEDDYKAARLRDLEAEYDRADAHLAAHASPRLTTAELADYAPPDPYAAGIKALQLKESR